MRIYNKKGFTLIELIVVIAIIGVLSAILVPSYMQYVERSKQTAVENEAKTIKTTIMAVITGEDVITFKETAGVCHAVDESTTPSTSIPTSCDGVITFDNNYGVIIELVPNQKYEKDNGEEIPTMIDIMLKDLSQTQLLTIIYESISGKRLSGYFTVNPDNNLIFIYTKDSKNAIIDFTSEN